MVSVGVNSGPYLRTYVAATDETLTFDGADRETDIWLHTVLHHPQYSSALRSNYCRAPTLSVWHIQLRSSIYKGHGPIPQDDYLGAYRKKLDARFQPGKRSVLSISHWGKHLKAYGRRHVVPEARLNDDFLTSLAQGVPRFRCYFSTMCHNCCTQQMCCATTMVILDPDTGITW